MPKRKTEKPLTVDDVALHHWKDTKAAFLNGRGDLVLCERGICRARTGRNAAERQRMYVKNALVVPAGGPQRRALDLWLVGTREPRVKSLAELRKVLAEAA